jgi:hypothetical protein
MTMRQCWARRGGILVFRDDRLVAANRRGLSLVGRSWEALDDTALAELVDMRSQAAKGQLRSANGATLIGRLGCGRREAAASNCRSRVRWRMTGGGDRRGAGSPWRQCLGGGAATSVHRSTIHRHLARQR